MCVYLKNSGWVPEFCVLYYILIGFYTLIYLGPHRRRTTRENQAGGKKASPRFNRSRTHLANEQATKRRADHNIYPHTWKHGIQGKHISIWKQTANALDSCEICCKWTLNTHTGTHWLLDILMILVHIPQQTADSLMSRAHKEL